MIPFHKLYSLIFKSFDVKSETNTIKNLIAENVTRLMIIKRSWIFALMIIWLPVLILSIAILNITVALSYHKDPITQYSVIIGVGISVLLFIFSVWNYIAHFRQIYHTPKIRTDFDVLLKELEEGDVYFTRFFNQTIVNQLILFGLMIWSTISYVEHRNESWSMIIFIDIGLFFLQWMLLGRYRKRMIDLEMDYNVVIPGKIMFVNQSGMLSSVNTMEGEKVKTISASYSGWLWSFFNFGTVEVMSEGDAHGMAGTMPMYYVTAPNETGRLIQSMIDRTETQEPMIPIAPKLPADWTHSTKIPNEWVGPTESWITKEVISKIEPRIQKEIKREIAKEVSRDVKGTVRDVLR